jgi:exopolyphosphatase / guanosine-5'-triphosphate,3'-diphosphate pyrophosphatase
LTRLGAVDIGTNSVRLLVADVEGAGRDAALTTVERRMHITRLGQGVDATRALAPDAIDRTLDVLREYRGVIDDLDVKQVRATATSAARDATNRDAFFGPASDALGVAPELLSGEEEARLSFLGATAGLTEPSPYLVVDIGGGSTEFVVGDREPEAWISIDVGSGRLTERHIRSDPPADAELDSVCSDAESAVQQAIRAVGTSARTLVGLAGTITTIAALILELKEYDLERIHHARLDALQVEEAAAMLNAMTVEERRRLPVMPRGREEVIVAGAQILVEVMEGFGFDDVLVSEADILDGLVLDLLVKG